MFGREHTIQRLKTTTQVISKTLLSYFNNVDKDLASIAGYSSHIDQLLLSSNGLNDVEENEENLNTRSKNNEKNNSCYEACIDELHLSCQGYIYIYMLWWNEYKVMKGTSYDSELASFMKDVRNYEQYAIGDYDFF
ncbi:hypothetical protein D0Y65_035954 [Glycine soja]|uniref:Uncharacterized protein n=1 Tax=Glycine soja TaxID=3848 RepID=A0A445HC64_GLYSO|nr:hypothetical protein D0Y65_035954 [Glycine soja]